MKKLIIISLLAGLTFDLTAQTLIATSHDDYATAHNNQRKIVRDSADNVYVIYVDWVNQQHIIKGVWLNRTTNEWSEPFEIVEGRNPTLAISANNQIHLVCQTDEETSRIIHSRTNDFTTWQPFTVISDTLHRSVVPVADIDGSGKLNIFWRQYTENDTKSLVYACIVDDSLVQRKIVLTKSEINDVAIANHLLYYNDNLLFAIHFDTDSLQFFISEDNMETTEMLYATKGSFPCISYNSAEEGVTDFNYIRFLYVNNIVFEWTLTEVEINENGGVNVRQLPIDYIDYVCIDDLLPPIGYSFLFKWLNGDLFHGFSYGGFSSSTWVTVLDTITSNDISYPSIAYKHFNPEFVDFIWMELNNDTQEIFHKRDEKYIYSAGVNDPEPGKGFTITGFPNPFADFFTIDVVVEEGEATPLLDVFNTRSQLIRRLNIENSEKRKFQTVWDGTNLNGEKVPAGTYILLCTVGDKRTARKVLFKP